MDWWLKAALVGAGTAVAAKFVREHLQARGWSEESTAAATGAATLIAYVAVARSLGDYDANVATAV